MPPSPPQPPSDAQPDGDSPPASSTDRTSETAAAAARPSDPDSDRSLKREVERLRAELERRDDRLQSVIDHYEGLLAEHRNHEEPADERTAFATLRHWLQ